LSLGVSGSATPLTTPNDLQSNNESPSFHGLQSTLPSGHHGVQQNMENIDSNTMLPIPVVSTDDNPDCLNQCCVDADFEASSSGSKSINSAPLHEGPPREFYSVFDTKKVNNPIPQNIRSSEIYHSLT
uniref:Protein tyrosine phosphatase non-receptor type 12 n=1 Tax=Rodentolepis nana TaxID=102285 RepID=A0A0R3TFK7_RODNA